ncbi:rifin [Plasmodium reichenowi]|uniref:Rifin n=1 Tax=Plasmodium reichenowi TaxID=5854 RepID=A0A060RQ27_PLARE|nr:rifin [Plasmodium reichenowi]
MKIHYINILLFALPLNILVYNQRNHNITPHHTYTNRSLCECELYAPANYDSDTEMKRVMQQFQDRTSQRFHEYDERMKTIRQKCKEKCDKEIQKIILKDKLEKQMAQHFDTLHTDIQNDAIPTCVCEKSMADKMEKECLKCTQNLGGIVAPTAGILGEIATLALSGWKNAAIDAATKYAMAQGALAGADARITAGIKAVIEGLDALNIEELGILSWKPYFAEGYCIKVKELAKIIGARRDAMCPASGSSLGGDKCTEIGISIGTLEPDGVNPGPPGTTGIETVLNGIVEGAEKTAETEASAAEAAKTATIKAAQEKAIETTFISNQTIIIASVIAIVVIVLIMVIIYLILRYRRKKKMKKKLQYIKLLEE